MQPSLEAPLLASPVAAMDGAPLLSDGAASRPSVKLERGLLANTGGGRLYRFCMCGRTDVRKQPRAGLRTRKAGAFEGLDFDDYWSPVAEAHLRSQSNSDHQRTAAIRWLLNFIIGVAVALVAVFIIFCVRTLTKWKFDAVYHLIDLERAGDVLPGVTAVAFIGFNILYVLPATLLVSYVAPAAGSSGIPEIKMILNGVKIPNVIRFKALVCRVIGNIFSVASGLPVGYEGPAVTIGAALAAGVSQGKSTTMGFDTRWSVYSDFRNDREKRDFIVCGAGAGVAAAFNAPVGGVLFSYEESASFWHRSLTWRALFCSMVAAYVIDVFLSGITNGAQWGQLSSPGMFNFGLFDGQIEQSWSAFELPLFVLIGVLGGLFGALFNAANKRLTQFRLAYVNSNKHLRVMEAVAITVCVSTIAFLVPRFLGTCNNIPEESAKAPYVDALVSFYCPEGQYNDIASLWFAPTEEAIRQLYHFTEGDPFHLSHLAVLFIVYTGLMCLASGCAVPAGLFIPTLLSGSALGRFMGQAANGLLPAGWSVDAGVYALIGSAAMLAGTTRMAISLAVILLECTGNYQYGLPIMLTLMSARFVGNLFNHGLYDMQIELRKWPILEERVKKSVANDLRVCDVMTPNPVVFQEVEKAGRVLDALQMVEHNGFPVVFSETMLRAHPRLGNLAGYIQRRHLAVLLANKAFHAAPPWQPFLPTGGGPTSSDADGENTPNTESATPRTVAEPHTAADIRLRFPRISESIRFPTDILRTAAAAASAAVPPTADAAADSNAAALDAARTGRVSGGTNLFRSSWFVSGSGTAVGSGSLNGGISASTAVNLMSSLPGARSSLRRRSTLPGGESALLGGKLIEPSTSAHLYNALFSQEYRYQEEPLLLHEAFEATYPRYPDVTSMTLSDAEREMYMDLRPYMDASPTTAHVNTPLPRAFKLFRSLGMRHMLVVNNCHDVVGIVTRHDLVIERLEDCVEMVHAMEEELSRTLEWEQQQLGQPSVEGGAPSVGASPIPIQSSGTKRRAFPMPARASVRSQGSEAGAPFGGGGAVSIDTSARSIGAPSTTPANGSTSTSIVAQLQRAMTPSSSRGASLLLPPPPAPPQIIELRTKRDNSPVPSPVTHGAPLLFSSPLSMSAPRSSGHAGDDGDGGSTSLHHMIMARPLPASAALLDDDDEDEDDDQAAI